MQVNGLTNLFNFNSSFIRVGGYRQPVEERQEILQEYNAREFTEIRKDILGLKTVLEDVGTLLEFSRRKVSRPATAISSPSLDFPSTPSSAATILSTSPIPSVAATPAVMQSTAAVVPQSAATIKSIAEVNTVATSYSPFGPDWADPGSTALATISGIYDGSNGTQDLTFSVPAGKGGLHGTDKITVDVLDKDLVLLEKININKNDPIDNEYLLSNGLIFTLGIGSLTSGDSFTLNVNDTVGSSVNPDGAFNGVRNNSPNLDTGFSVTGGSFTVNGTTINVAADDSLNDVLSAITASAANVTATYNLATDEVELTHKIEGADYTVTLADDTSGFLAAMKLDTAVVTPGVDGFSYTDGSFEINGEIINVLAADSLNTVLDKITASDANVTAVYDPDTDSVVLTQKTTGAAPTITLASDTSGFLSGMNLDTAVVTPGHDEEDFYVVNGSFDVNGETINVLATDSLNTVLDKITASAANVIATYDSSTQLVTLTQNTAGSVPTITIDNDTAQFLTEAHLDTAVVTPGVDEANIDISPLSSLSAFSSVTSGTFKINGEEISIDVDADRLSDIIDRINASGVEVTASINPSSTKVTILSDKVKSRLVIDSNDTNFFNSLSIRDTTYLPRKGKKGVARRYAIEITNKIDKASKILNKLFNNNDFSSATTDFLSTIRSDIQDAAATSFGEKGPRFKTDFGIDFNFQNNWGKIFDFTASDKEQLERTLYHKIEGVLDIFSEEEGGGNFLGRMISALDNNFADFNPTENSTGFLVDTFA